MKSFLRTLAVAVVGTLVIAAPALAGGPQKEYNASASEWSSSTVASPGTGVYPIGGSGQLNGQFTIVSYEGIEIGLRASNRYNPTLIVPNRDKYPASPGWTYQSSDGPCPNSVVDPGDPTGWDWRYGGCWNFDIQVDLRNGTGAYAGTTLGQYELNLKINKIGLKKTNIVGDPRSSCGATNDWKFCPNAVLAQDSTNPNWWDVPNGTFDPDRQTTYDVELELKPTKALKSLGAKKSLKVKIKVKVDAAP